MRIKSVVVVQRGPEGRSSEVLRLRSGSAGKEPRRRTSKAFRPLEKLERRVLQSADRFTSELLRRHRRSTRKRKDGWLLDAPRNVYEAGRKASKQLGKLTGLELPC